jgi:hypothetical protein
MAREGAQLLPSPEGPVSSAAPVDLRVPSDIQRLWFATQGKPWSVMAVVPSLAGASAARVAEALAHVGTQARGRKVRFLNAQDADLPKAAATIEEAVASSQDYCATIVAVGDPVTSPAAIPIGIAADALLLCVELGETRLRSAKETVDCFGHGRFLGAVAIVPDPKPR